MNRLNKIVNVAIVVVIILIGVVFTNLAMMACLRRGRAARRSGPGASLPPDSL